MAESEDHARVDTLHRLLDLEVPVDEALGELRAFPWDSDELVDVTRAHLARVLGHFGRGDLSEAQVIRWAEVVHLRDDIGRAAGDEDLVNELLIEMSSPELFGPLTEIATDLQQRLAAP